jgi:DNA-binding transcriptional ArsR family regulator
MRNTPSARFDADDDHSNVQNGHPRRGLGGASSVIAILENVVGRDSNVTALLEITQMTRRNPEPKDVDPLGRREASVAEAKAAGSSLRMRILRWCAIEPRTNRELADLLERDPSTIVHHVKILEDVGFLEALPARPGPHGGSVKPYRATGLSWNVNIPLTGDNSNLASFEAFREELAAAGPDSVLATTRFFLHADEDTFSELEARLTAIAREYVETDDQRRAAGHPIVNGFMIFHRFANEAHTPE